LANSKKPRSRLLLVFGIVAAIAVYALAVERTGVSLDEITSESRQNQLVRIVRNLARPELVTYDFEEINTDVEFFIPCPAGMSGPVSSGGVTIDPGCGSPKDVVTIRGTGFEPFDEGRITFIPESEFDVTLPLGRFAADENGDFTAEVTLPDRESDQPQIMRVTVPIRLGTWGERVEVWTDTNENGVRDDGIVGPGGLEVTVQGARTDNPAAALLDPTNQVVEFVTPTELFIAVDGPAKGGTAEPVGETPGDITIAELRTQPTAVIVRIAAPEGTDLSSWRVAIYDGDSGEVLNTEPLGDQIDLSPRISEQTELTVDKIIDTVFLALVATTVGLTVALPLSFIAARNLMRDVSTTVIGLGLGLIAIPLGVAIGFYYINFQRFLIDGYIDGTTFRLLLVGVGGAVTYFLARRIFFGEPPRSLFARTGRSVATMVALALTLEGLFALLTRGGLALEPSFGPFGFIPGLFATVGEVGAVLIPGLVGLIGASIVLGLASKAALWLNARQSQTVRTLAGFLAMGTAGVIVAVLIGTALDWLYQIANATATVTIPAIVGGVVGLGIAELGRRRGEIKIGLSIYYIARTIFNTLRSIEPLVMVIVFVVWVGFGELAGSVALALHTSAALAKLYSEQVESISEGPLEAVRATGATRLQTIVYAVVPQIVPPYIAFTMYRWDINVRMSTILGFAGGGGIGFLLQQNVQLGDYRAAAVQMLAIAIVVASMDYSSSRIRERFT
jgi:ABC-type phosphate/phosphonate transport system permease subunit